MVTICNSTETVTMDVKYAFGRRSSPRNATKPSSPPAAVVATAVR